MTGRRLYELVTDELRRARGYQRSSYYDANVCVGNFENEADAPPPAFAFLIRYEQDAWNAAAKRVKGRR